MGDSIPLKVGSMASVARKKNNNGNTRVNGAETVTYESMLVIWSL